MGRKEPIAILHYHSLALPGSQRDVGHSWAILGGNLGHQELWQLWSVSYWVLAVFWHVPSVPGADSCKSGPCV